ncbi:cysteine hydrolase [Rhizobium binxianense]
MAKISRLRKELSAQHVGLVLFDSLNGYLHPDGAVKVEFLAERNILPNLQRLQEGARSVGMTTFYPIGQHGPDNVDSVERLTDTDMDLQPGPKAPIVPRFHKGSWEAQVADEVRPLETDVIVPKNRWSSFFSTNLDMQLRVRGIDTIVLAGGSTDVGIASTMFSARDLDYGIVVVRDACFSARGNNHDFFMDRVFPRMGRVMNVDEAVALMAA